MRYEDALNKWGASKLGTDAKPEAVIVQFEFSEGYACCGGTDPSCYCSFYESPSAGVRITDASTGRWTSIDASDFDFVTVLAEIVAAGDGTLTS